MAEIFALTGQFLWPRRVAKVEKSSGDVLAAPSLHRSGVDGWQSHTFDPPVALEQFTVERTELNANIMEVLVCVEP